MSIVESLNGIDESEAIDTGHPLLPMTTSEASAFKTAQARASRLRATATFASVALAGFKQHQMVRGETVWGIARRHGKLPCGWSITQPELNLTGSKSRHRDPAAARNGRPPLRRRLRPTKTVKMTKQSFKTRTAMSTVKTKRVVDVPKRAQSARRFLISDAAHRGNSASQRSD